MCGRNVHWAGDPECSGGSGRAAVAADVDEEDGDFDQFIHETIVVHFLAAARSPARGARDAGCGIFDTACMMTVKGGGWRNDYLNRLAESNLALLAAKDKVNETFGFGNGGSPVATECHRFPAVAAGMAIFAEACVVPTGSLVLRLGSDFLESVGAAVDTARRQLRVGSRTADPPQSTSSHYSIDPKAAAGAHRCRDLRHWGLG